MLKDLGVLPFDIQVYLFSLKFVNGFITSTTVTRDKELIPVDTVL